MKICIYVFAIIAIIGLIIGIVYIVKESNWSGDGDPFNMQAAWILGFIGCAIGLIGTAVCFYKSKHKHTMSDKN